MKRRTLLKSTAVVFGYGISATAVAGFVSGCKVANDEGWTPVFLSKNEATTLSEVCERIIPRTDTPGAKDALVHRYIDAFIPANLSDGDSENFKKAMAEFDQKAKELYRKKFVALNEQEMDAVLNDIADEGGEMNIFEAVKNMTILAFFTSETGTKDVLKFDPVPGAWESCIPLSDVGGAWALGYMGT